MKVAGLFAGIGGIEAGLHRAGFSTHLLCEIDAAACKVLETRFPGVDLRRDVTALRGLPSGTEVLTAGFPCQDLSQAGRTKGLDGSRSGLIGEVFRLLRRKRVPLLVIENVPFMLQLNGGQAIRHIIDELEALGYAWAYRIVDSRCFGLPQRRERVYLVASKEIDPALHLFREDAGVASEPEHTNRACGFYWTEGNRGLGWAVDAVPTLKGGSALGIPSPPAIWLPNGRIVRPDIRDAERLQGFAADWTKPAEEVARDTVRWKLVGNAVTVDAAEWVGRAILGTALDARPTGRMFSQTKSWPAAAAGKPGEKRLAIDVSKWPVARRAKPLEKFLKHPPRLLSLKAVSGFVSRLKASSLRYPPEFMDALERHRVAMGRNVSSMH